MEHFRLFVLPFWVGAGFLLVVLLYKYISWFIGLAPAERKMFWRSLPTRATWKSVCEIGSESLLHRKIWRTNPLLGYMHTSFALGWFLLILTGWIETLVYFKGHNVPLYVDIFFSYYVHPIFERNFNFSLIKDALLLLILIGIGLALFKRIRSRAMGMRRTTKHVLGDRIALTALWFIFPARLLAESFTSGVLWKFGGIGWALGDQVHIIPPGIGGGSFLTNTTGELLANTLPNSLLIHGELPMWWFYSISLGVFFFALPFSRYMHIFTEIPLIFLRNAGIRSGVQEKSYDHFQIEACSRCGICIDPCQLQSAAGIDNVQSVYFLRDRRYGHLTDAVADNCLLCGRCVVACPVGIELGTLRLNSRAKNAVACAPDRYNYIKGLDRSEGEGKVGYFAGCMTLLSPKILRSMEQIFKASGEQVWWADKDGGVCCGRPLKLSGEIEAARRMMDYNTELFRKHGIRTLVTSCPICLKVFREDYRLDGIEVLHHSEYIQRLITAGKLKLHPGTEVFTYHDPCELGRGSGIYEAPREVIGAIGELREVAENREHALCCGSSLGNIAISDDGQRQIGQSVADTFAATGAGSVVTACPLCKKAIARSGTLPVYDLAEIVAQALPGRQAS